jgi:hypothetical protein
MSPSYPPRLLIFLLLFVFLVNFSAQVPTQNGITQGSPIYPLLFPFYNADVVEICNPDDLSAATISIVDDVNPLAFGESTPETCETLKILYELSLI